MSGKSYLKDYAKAGALAGVVGAASHEGKVQAIKHKANKEEQAYRNKVGDGPEPGIWVTDSGFYGHPKAGKSDKFYKQVQNCTGY